jgi:hypothetical protein
LSSGSTTPLPENFEEYSKSAENFQTSAEIVEFELQRKCAKIGLAGIPMRKRVFKIRIICAKEYSKSA